MRVWNFLSPSTVCYKKKKKNVFHVIVFVVKRQKAALRCQILVLHELWGTKKGTHLSEARRQTLNIVVSLLGFYDCSSLPKFMSSLSLVSWLPFSCCAVCSFFFLLFIIMNIVYFPLIFLSLILVFWLPIKKKIIHIIHSNYTCLTLRVRMGTTYLTEIENFLLKVI